MIVDHLIFLTKSELRRIFSDQEYVFFNSLSEGGNRRNAECKLEGGGGRGICQNREGGERGDLNATCYLACHLLYCLSFHTISIMSVALLRDAILKKS